MESYKSGNDVFYFLIDKRQPEKDSKTMDRYSKIAWAIKRSMDDDGVEDVTIFDAGNKEILLVCARRDYPTCQRSACR